MLIRIGIPASFRRLCAAAREIGAPTLVSANAFWRDGDHFTHSRDEIFQLGDVAIDSAGFVAMARYWHYPWSLDRYVDFVARARPTWWAAPDYCCEPEIARDRAEVLDRVARTAEKLHWANAVAADRGVPPPMPVIQGWFPDDYLRCAERMTDLPDLVGIGSVCRRDLGGTAGVVSVLSRLDAELPRHVRFHLFGVKGAAIRALAGHPRIASIDSAAWDFNARRRRDLYDGKYTIETRAAHMKKWYGAQRDALGLWAV